MRDEALITDAEGPPSGSMAANDLGDLVDLTLVDATLSMTVDERLRQNDRMVRTALALARQTGRASWLVDG